MNVAEILTSHLGAPLVAIVMYISWLLRTFSRRLGEVTHMPPYYRWFDIGNLFIFLALVSYIFQCSAALAGTPQLLLETSLSLFMFYMPLLIGIIINLIITFIYWGWLIKQK